MLSRKVMPEKIRWTLTCLVSLFLLFSFVFRAAQAEEIVLEFAMWIVEPAEIEPTLEIIRTYEEMNPGVKINLIHQPWTGYHDKMMTLGIAGTAPDVMAISRVYLANFVEANLLLPLTKEIEPLLDEIIEIQSGMHEGEIYGIPVWGGPSLWMYNGGMFDLAGLQRPPEVYRQGDWNWDTVLDMARKLTYDRDGDGVIDVWAFESPSTIATDWVAKVHQFGGRVLTEDGKGAAINEPAAIAGLTRWVRPPGPWRFSKLRFVVDRMRCPGSPLSPFEPAHIEQAGSPHVMPASLNMRSSPLASASRLTRDDPGTTHAVTPSATLRPFTMAAASSSSTGTCSTKPYSSQMVNGRFTATYSSTRPHRLLTSCHSLQIMNTGTAITASGTVRSISVA